MCTWLDREHWKQRSEWWVHTENSSIAESRLQLRLKTDKDDRQMYRHELWQNVIIHGQSRFASKFICNKEKHGWHPEKDKVLKAISRKLLKGWCWYLWVRILSICVWEFEEGIGIEG